MKSGGKFRGAANAETIRALRSVMAATGGNAKVRELYQVLRVEEAAEFLGIAVQTVRNMTALGRLPCTRMGPHCVGYQLIDLIAWLQKRQQPARRETSEEIT
ncbi:helix-turn-helix domain-containing protein [Candidatus Binatus sp.]|uniref:helix-turn-helix transcriptional regulator n=1 Tax=Candidatus Binatus sp. TaxID=2811406 RepID=UPI002F959AD1